MGGFSNELMFGGYAYACIETAGVIFLSCGDGGCLIILMLLSVIDRGCGEYQ